MLLLKAYIFSGVLDGESLELPSMQGKPCHNFGPTTENAFPPHLLCTCGPQRCRVSEEDLRSGRGMVKGSSSEEKYAEPTLFTHLTAKRSGLHFKKVLFRLVKWKVSIFTKETRQSPTSDNLHTAFLSL